MTNATGAAAPQPGTPMTATDDNSARLPDENDAPPRVDRLGASLRRVFDDAAAEPLPQAFEDLLRKLR